MHIILETPRLAMRQFTEDDVIEGAEHGEVEYALTKSEWQSRPQA